MAEQVTVWWIGFPWGTGPFTVRAEEGSRTEKQVRVKSSNRGGYSIYDPGSCHYSERDAADAALEGANESVRRARAALALEEAQLEQVAAYYLKREGEGWA